MILHIFRQQASSAPGDESATIVDQARSGDPDAFNSLFHSYNSRICTYLARMVGNDEEGRDLAQETFFKAWRTLPGLLDPTCFGPWLYRIATNVAIDHLRTQKSRRWLPWPRADTPSAAEEPFQTLDSTAGVAETEHVRQALASITPKYRACLLLQIEGGFPQREIAALLHLSEKSISIYVQRASEQFRLTYTRLASDQTITTERDISHE